MRILLAIARVASLSVGLNLVQASNSLPLFYSKAKGNDMTPEEYCPHLGSTFPPEDGCYPGGGMNPSGYPKCCSKQQRGVGSCPNNRRPPCENNMVNAPSYCADLRPNFECYINGWPQCCVGDGTKCPSNVPDCDVNLRSSEPPSQTPTLEPSTSMTPTPTLESLQGKCILKPPYDANHDSGSSCGSDSFCSIPKGVCKNNAVLVGTCEKKSQKIAPMTSIGPFVVVTVVHMAANVMLQLLE